MPTLKGIVRPRGPRAFALSGAMVTVIFVVVALTGVVWAFLANASPYVTIAEARTNGGSRLHIAGNILKNTVDDDRLKGKLQFDLQDANGDKIHVIHIGEPPSNMGDATQVVAIGSIKGNDFVSEKMLVKCPTKYEPKSNPLAGVARNGGG